MKLAQHRTILITALVLLLLVAFCAIQFPFILSTQVLGNLLTDNAFLGMLAIGMTVVILSGGIDLSVGSVLAFVNVFIAIVITRWGLHPGIAFALSLLIGAGFGAVQGAAIHFLRAPAFIVTLAGMFLARGACLLLTDDSIPINHAFYAAILDGSLPLPAGGRLSVSAMLMLLLFVIAAVVLRRTRFGADIYALGGDPRAAELMGVRTGRTTVAVYAFSGCMAAAGGILYSLYTQSGYPLAGIGLELDAIAATIIGGTLLSGGYGGVIGTFLALLILGLIQLYITLQGTWSSWVAKIVIGGLLLMFILIQRLAPSRNSANNAAA